MIIELSKMQKCMMLKATKYQDLVVIDILVQRKIYLELKMYIKGKFQLPHKKHRHSFEKLLINNILETQN
jgi:hypothetical protein